MRPKELTERVSTRYVQQGPHWLALLLSAQNRPPFMSSQIGLMPERRMMIAMKA